MSALFVLLSNLPTLIKSQIEEQSNNQFRIISSVKDNKQIAHNLSSDNFVINNTLLLSVNI